MEIPGALSGVIFVRNYSFFLNILRDNPALDGTRARDTDLMTVHWDLTGNAVSTYRPMEPLEHKNNAARDPSRNHPSK